MRHQRILTFAGSLLIISMLAFSGIFFLTGGKDPAKKRAKAVKKLVKKAWKHLKAFPPEYKEATEYLDEAFLIDSTHAQVNALLGIYYHVHREPAKAIQFYARAIRHGRAGIDYPKEILLLAGKVAHLLEKLDIAEQWIKQYMDILTPAEREATEVWNLIIHALERRLPPTTSPEIELPQPYQRAQKILQEIQTARELMKDPLPVRIVNLGDSINSPWPEYAPVINADESMLFFTARRPGNVGGKTDPLDGLPFEDAFLAYRMPDGKGWYQAKNLGEPINSPFHESVIGVSVDGQTLFLFREGDIYVSELKGTRWTKPRALPKPINLKESAEKSVALFPDGSKMLIVSDRPGGYGGLDIWIVYKDRKGRWKEIQNAGPTINTPYDEEGLFLHPDGRTLYFSSQGHRTMGGFDVFKTVYENGKWSEPVNVGYPINTTGDDVYFVISSDGKRAYFASNRADSRGATDIYVLILEEEKLEAKEQEGPKRIRTSLRRFRRFKPSRPVTVVKGIVYDSLSKDPLEALVIIVDNATGDTLYTVTSNSATGKYVVTLPAGKNYGMAVAKEGYLFFSQNFNIPKEAQYREVQLNVPLLPLRKGAVVALRNIFFEFDKAELKPESYPELDRVVALLQQYPNLKVEIAGHTDNVGSEEYNLRLSQKRAEAVVRYLVSKGIDPSRLIAKGYGESQPIASNDTEEGRALNRRVEFRIIED